jgi:MPBQ/MSBQ methyltransferase
MTYHTADVSLRVSWQTFIIVGMATNDADAISAHYTAGDLATAIANGLRAVGKDADHPTIDDLAPVDQFHLLGKPGTLALARRTDLRAGMRVLDLGGGLGGAARTLASTFACHVMVLDVTEEFCRVGAMLTARMGMDDRVTFRHGDATAIPFPDASFDVAWTQQAAMNIADKMRLYAEILRVLRPQGRYAFQEVLAGPVQPIHFPVPWASNPTLSFLSSADDMRSGLRASGLAEVVWVDMTEEAVAFARERAAAAAKQQGPTPPLGLHLVQGADMPTKTANSNRNFFEQRTGLAHGVFMRP